VQGAAGVGHQRRHAKFDEHVRGRPHLGGPAHRVPAGAVGDPVQGGGVGRGEHGADVLAQPLLLPCGPGSVQGLDDRGRHPLVEHAAQELLAGGEPGRAVEHLDGSAQRPEQGGVTGGAGPAGQHGDAQAAPGHRRHHGHVSERHARVFGEAGQLSFGARRGRVQVGPQDARPRPPACEQAGQPGLERLDRGLGAVDAQHQARFTGRVGFADGVKDGFGRGDRRIVATDPRPGSGQVARDE